MNRIHSLLSLSACLSLGAIASGQSAPKTPATTTIQPIFGVPGDADFINKAVDRAIGLKSVTIDTKKIAETLDKGYPNIKPPLPKLPRSSDSLSDQVQTTVPSSTILLAGNEPKDAPSVQAPTAQTPAAQAPAPAGKDSEPLRAEFQQTIDAINGLFKTQGDLIRSINVSKNNFQSSPPPPRPMVMGGRTGFELAPVPPEMAAELKIPADQGLLIKNVFPKTPAEEAGYKKNDVLIEFNKRKVPNDLRDFMDLVFRFVRNDTPIPGVVLREGEKVDVGAMTLTSRRVVPALPNEQPADLTQLIQIAPGINSKQADTVRVRELRAVRRPNGITEFIWVDPTGKR